MIVVLRGEAWIIKTSIVSPLFIAVSSSCQETVPKKKNFEDNKRVVRSRNWRNDIQYNAQNKTDKGTNNDIQSNTQKIKD